MRILHCFRSPLGGIFRHVRDLAEEHSRLGHQVGILCDSTTGGSYEDKLFDGIRPYLALGLTRLPISRAVGLSDVVSAMRVFREVKSLQPDVLHGHGAKGGAYARIIGSRLRVNRSRVARLYSPHGGSLHYDASSASGKFYFAVERFLERWTDSLVFVSDYERRTYTEKVGEPRTHWQIILNGLTEPEFEPVEKKSDAADFLYIGMMRDLKGPDVFIDAFAKAEQLTGRPLRAVMVGDGEDKDRYQTMIERRGLGDRISMRPAMPARRAFAMANAMSVPSRAESMPYIVLEAVAAGQPLIASNVGGIPEILGPDCAALMPPGDADALAKAMARTADNPSWLENAMPDPKTFRSRFSSHVMAGKIARLYESCLKTEQEIGVNGTASNLS